MQIVAAIMGMMDLFTVDAEKGSLLAPNILRAILLVLALITLHKSFFSRELWTLILSPTMPFLGINELSHPPLSMTIFGFSCYIWYPERMGSLLGLLKKISKVCCILLLLFTARTKSMSTLFFYVPFNFCSLWNQSFNSAFRVADQDFYTCLNIFFINFISSLLLENMLEVLLLLQPFTFPKLSIYWISFSHRKQ